jgi:cell division protein FtsB
MSGKQNYKQPSRWTSAVDTAQTRAYGLRRKAATVAVGTLAVFMGYHVVFGNNGLTAYEHKRENTKALRQQMLELQQENDRLRGHVVRLQSDDPSAIEHQAREELHYTRSGEVIYTLPPDPPSAAPSASKP